MIVVQQVNVGARSKLERKDGVIDTGIFKTAVEGPVTVSELGLAQDVICDTTVHGGPDQAVYLYRTEDYDWWSGQLGRVVASGSFGENLSVAGLESPELFVGDRLRFANLELEVTAPRIPCATLATVMGDTGFAKAFMQAGRPGIYFRVTNSGTIAAGDHAELIPYDRDSISTVTFFHDYHRKHTKTELQRYLALPIDIRSRVFLQDQLDKLNGG